jgi:hypothetical protein
MATSDSARPGLDHPTVVPANFEPDDSRCAVCGEPDCDH